MAGKKPVVKSGKKAPAMSGKGKAVKGMAKKGC